MSKYFTLLDKIAIAAKTAKTAKKSCRESAMVKLALAENEWRRATTGLTAAEIGKISDEWAGRKSA